MSVEMFPDNEVTDVDDNIFIHKPKFKGTFYQVWFFVDNQYFKVGEGYDTIKEAKWMSSMFQKALNKVKK